MPVPNEAHPRYHHGNLREALITTCLELARHGGPDAISIRESARLNGVSANAAYRHFRDLTELRAEVAACARGQLAETMTAELAHLPRRRTAARRALEQLRAVGRAYIRFALDEPHLFRTAWSDDSMVASEPSAWSLLQEALSACVAASVIPPNKAHTAGMAAWSLVHGFADLAHRGLLNCGSRQTLDKMAEGVLDIFVGGWNSTLE